MNTLEEGGCSTGFDPGLEPLRATQYLPGLVPLSATVVAIAPLSIASFGYSQAGVAQETRKTQLGPEALPTNRSRAKHRVFVVNWGMAEGLCGEPEQG